MFAFSTCWNSKRHTDGQAMLAEVRALGFEYAELGHATRLSLVDGIRAAVAAGEIKISSLHNFCPLPVGLSGPAPDYYRPSSQRETERQLAVRHTLRTIEFAASLGAKFVVLHLGSVDMREYTDKLMQLFAEGRAGTPKFDSLRVKAVTVRAQKRQRNFDQLFRSLDELVPHALSAGVRLGVETRFAIEEIPSEGEIAEIIARYGTEALAYWHDVGHAQVKENFGLTNHESLLERYRKHTAGMHLQDFAPPAFDHQPPGAGTFDFTRLAPYVTDEMVLAWEIHPNWSAGQIGDACRRAHELLRPAVRT
jgi:sugar phosphate isomerase/epimerase